jgi:hypothetical protein
MTKCASGTTLSWRSCKSTRARSDPCVRDDIGPAGRETDGTKVTSVSRSQLQGD